MKEISLADFENLRVGQAEIAEAGTGLTVLICENGAAAGLDVRGGGPSTRESELMNPLTNASFIHAVLLSGGSSFALGASDGVMRYLEERGIGYDVGVARVPLVCQADLFDLKVASSSVRPDAELAYRACVDSENGVFRPGNHGAGTGATVGKLYDMRFCMKSGIGFYGVQTGDLKLGALVAVNALGDVFDWKTGRKAAGLLNETRDGFRSSTEEMYKSTRVVENKITGNTTLGVVFTNAKFDKTRLCKIAGMAQNGYARAIRPVHTTADGDSIFSLSLGDVTADMDMVGTLAADVVAEAILRATTAAEAAYGFPAARDFINA